MPADGGPSRATRRVGRAQLRRLSASLSQRDLAVLQSVAAHRFLGTRHIEGLHFADHATPLSGARSARRVLQRLQRLWRCDEPACGKLTWTEAGSAIGARAALTGDRFVESAIRQAVALRSRQGRPIDGAIHHSDAGWARRNQLVVATPRLHGGVRWFVDNRRQIVPCGRR